MRSYSGVDSRNRFARCRTDAASTMTSAETRFPARQQGDSCFEPTRVLPELLYRRGRQQGLAVGQFIPNHGQPEDAPLKPV